jgi:deoxyadenosine/deoxycytidine kinase
MRTEIIGSVGTGKSTLSRAIEAHLERRPELEWHFAYDGIDDNLPFRLFQGCPGTFHVEKNIVFLVNHATLIKSMAVPPGRSVFCDFSLIADLAYGDLSDAVYQGSGTGVLDCVYDWIEGQIGPADCLIWLTCDLETQLARIRTRARNYETRGLGDDAVQTPYSAAYLSGLNAVLEQHLASQRSRSPMIRIDTSLKESAGWPADWLDTIVDCIERAVRAGEASTLNFP